MILNLGIHIQPDPLTSRGIIRREEVRTSCLLEGWMEEFVVGDHQFRSLAKDLIAVEILDDTISGEPSCHEMETVMTKHSRMTGRIEDTFTHILSKDEPNRSTVGGDMAL